MIEEDKQHPLADWRADVAAGNTQDSYMTWLFFKRLQAERNRHTTVTAFCQELLVGSTGTMWIETVNVPSGASVDTMKRIACERCAEAWEFELSDVQCVGIAEGDVDVIYWDDE